MLCLFLTTETQHGPINKLEFQDTNAISTTYVFAKTLFAYMRRFAKKEHIKKLNLIKSYIILL